MSLMIGPTWMGKMINPWEDFSSSSYAFMVIFLLGSIAFLEYLNAQTSLRVQIFRPTPPSIRTRLTQCLWIRTSMWREELCKWVVDASSCSENDKKWGAFKCPTIAWNVHTSILFCTVVATKAFSRISLCAGEILRSSNMDISAGIFYNWSMMLYWVTRKIVILDVEG